MGVDFRPCLLPKRRTFVPTSAQVADFVKRLRESGWLAEAREPGQHERPTQWIRRPPERGHKDRRQVLPLPLTAAIVEQWRRPSSANVLEDELLIQFEVDVDETDDDEEEVPPLRHILLVDDEHHPRSYEFQLWWTRELITCWGENAREGDPASCACGTNLEYSSAEDRSRVWDGIIATRVRAVCPSCRRPYDPEHDERTIVRSESDGYYFNDPKGTRNARKVTRLTSHVVVAIDFSKDWPRLGEEHALTLHPELLALCESSFGESFEAVHLFF